MKKFLHSHPSLVLGALTLIFLSVLIAFYFWAIDDVFTQFRSALIAPPPQSEQSFNLAGAAALGLPGIVNIAPSSTSSPLPFSLPSTPAATSGAH